MNTRRQSRELALQILFQREFSKDISVKELVSLFMKHLSLSDEIKNFAVSVIEVAIANQEDIDALIQKHCHNWKLERLSLVDLNLMRVAVCEVLFIKEDATPPKVAMNEALEISKKYSSQESPQFLNGILDQLLKDECGYE